MSNAKRAAYGFAAAAMGGALVIPALSASAALLPGPVHTGPASASTARTHISNTGDSGNNGNVWAIDAYDRTLTITETGHTGSTHSYTARVQDKGTFRTVKGAEDPNSTGTELNAVDGTLTGSADYSFTANALPSGQRNLGVETSVTRNGTYYDNDPISSTTHKSSLVPDDAGTSYWYSLAFPSGTTFGGSGIGAYDYVYKTGCETWTDSSSVTAANSGNITGKACRTPGHGGRPAPSPTHTWPGGVGTSRGTGYVHSLYATGLCLDNKDAHWVSGNPVQLWACGASAGGVAGGDQMLRYISTGRGTHALEFAHDGQFWAVTSMGAGTQAVIEVPGNGTGSQDVTRSGDYYVAGNHSVLDNKGFGKVSGTEVLFYAENGGQNQLWSAPK